jgi:hypothetical protein
MGSGNKQHLHSLCIRIEHNLERHHIEKTYNLSKRAKVERSAQRNKLEPPIRPQRRPRSLSSGFRKCVVGEEHVPSFHSPFTDVKSDDLCRSRDRSRSPCDNGPTSKLRQVQTIGQNNNVMAYSIELTGIRNSSVIDGFGVEIPWVLDRAA